METMENGTVIPQDPQDRIVTDVSLKLFPDNLRTLFYWIMLTVAVVSLVGNVLAIRSILLRKCKHLQKCCIICLAVADIMSIIVFSINYLSTLSQELVTWNVGEFLCYFIPTAQVWGTTASSVSLLVIAVDRYKNVIHAVGKRWDPMLWKCVLTAILLWIACGAISYPMYTYYIYIKVKILYTQSRLGPYFEDGYMCVSTTEIKPQLMTYYVTMAFIVFLPISVVFVLFYFKIASLIWRHRKPIGQRIEYISNSEEIDNSSGLKSTSETVEKNLKSIMKKGRNVQVERKIRTFKIVVTLMLSFVCCRLPYWTYFVIRLIYSVTGLSAWTIHLSFITLNMLSCALNPFLYTFLNQTIYTLKKLNDFICKICCCFFSNNEFEDFEKENPFPVLPNTKDPPQIIMESLKSPKNCRVKFLGVKQIQRY